MTLKTIALFLGFLLVYTFSLYAQPPLETPENNNEKDKIGWDLGMEGMLGVAVGDDFYAFNVGGPSLHLRLNDDWKIGVGALPSFYIKEGKTGAKLGVSPRVDYKNFVLIAPFYHFDSTEKWVWTVGIGYKFFSKKKRGK